MKLINPLEVFGQELNTVQSPSRYLGGEYGAIVKPHSAKKYYNVAVAFPDLYEIGMSNQAIKIIYNGLNKIENIRCEMVFAPDLDFEHLLKNKNIPLYTLTTGMPLNEVDILAFSIGYELGATEILAMLEAGHIPLLSSERTEDDPIVIAGGCGITNPAPMGNFFDAIMVGEAEAGLFDLVEELSLLTQQNKTRTEKIAFIESKPFMWTKKSCTPYGKKVAKRAIQVDFGLKNATFSYFPLPVNKPIQDHGVVEIMRGCPNGCRFCHAGIYYRPARVKKIDFIIEEIDKLVFEAGYREISLNSLSSADFPNIESLLDVLNKRYNGYNVSFQLPSLKVNSLSLPILEKLSTVRKSGLTFAVETPEEMWQLSLNKEVYAQHLESIIKEAKIRGWSSAKFYFMLGLPVGDYFDKNSSLKEEEAIVNFLLDLQSHTHIQCNVNIGIFIPKPHTPYQWVKQISVEEAIRKTDYIFTHLPKGKFKISRHNFDATILEGLLSRGDERVGSVILDAYKQGARFDAWDDRLKDNIKFWKSAFSHCDWDVMADIYRERDENETLAWDSISLGPTKAFYKREWQKSKMSELTPKCANKCTNPCGLCSPKTKVHIYSPDEIKTDATFSTIIKDIPQAIIRPKSNIPILYRVIFTFTRKNGAEFIAYLSQVETFHKAILRSSLPIVFSSGFNL